MHQFYDPQFVKLVHEGRMAEPQAKALGTRPSRKRVAGCAHKSVR